jgi:hypothetical protein
MGSQKKNLNVCGRKSTTRCITITILDITYHPVFYSNQDVSETGFCLRIQVETTQVGPYSELVSVSRQKQKEYLSIGIA